MQMRALDCTISSGEVANGTSRAEIILKYAATMPGAIGSSLLTASVPEAQPHKCLGRASTSERVCSQSKQDGASSSANSCSRNRGGGGLERAGLQPSSAKIGQSRHQTGHWRDPDMVEGRIARCGVAGQAAETDQERTTGDNSRRSDRIN